MPLAANFPVIDNRRFADIVDEAKARIPRYTPEWTDFNPGDPGFALVELFAWMSEMLIYRMNQTPKLHYLKFLELVGIELLPAKSATAVLAFPVQAMFAGTSVIVPALTQVATGEPDADGRPIVFETERSLTALRAVLDGVQAFDGYGYANVAGLNADGGGGFLPFGALANAGAALMLGFSDNAALPPGVELSLAVWPKAASVAPPPTPCGATMGSPVAPAVLRWEYWAGSEWRPMDVLADDTLALTRSGIILLKLPGVGEAVKAKIGAATDKARYWLRARLERSSYQVPPLLTAVRANVVRSTEAQTVADEVLGGSDGSPDQVFRVANAPVLPGSLVVDVYENDKADTWRAVEDFFGAGPDDAVYVADAATGAVRFAGREGRIPVANVDRPTTSIVARRYRFGGGARGNVAAGAISAMMGGLAGIDAGKVANPFAAVGGADEESIETAMARAPQAIKARDRAVSAADFELLAKQAGPIARARAMPLVHPDFPGIEVPGVVTVVVIPDGDVMTEPAPRPVESLLRTVCAYLDVRRLLTTELYVVGPTYVPVSVRIEAVLDGDRDSAEVAQAVEAAVRRFLHPLVGGNDGTGWAFGGPIRYAELYRQGLVPGVRRLDSITVSGRERDYGNCEDVPLPPGALVELLGVSVSVIEEAVL